MKSNTKKSIITASIFIIFGVISRFLLVNQPNVSGIETLALFGGSYFLLKRFAFIIPLGAYILSDFIINNTIYSAYYSEGLVFFQSYMIGTIVALILIVIFGKLFLKNVTTKNTALGVIGATTIFWLVSNFGDWLGGITYPKTAAGLISCYIAAIPFYAYSLIGNAAFGIILFGGYEWIKSEKPNFALESSNK